MKKIIPLIAVAIVMVSFTSISFAKNDKDKKVESQKVEIYEVTTCNSDRITDIPYQGHVTIVDPMGENDLLLHGVINGLEAETTYYLWVRDLNPGYSGDSLNSYLPLGYYKLMSFVTDEYGHGTFNYHINDMDLVDGEYDLQIAINHEDGYTNNIGCTVAATEKYIEVTVK